MAMGKKSTSALHDLFVSLRRVVVLVVTAFALSMKWPLSVVATRALILWATLVVLTHAAEILFQYLSHRAIMQENSVGSAETSGGASRS